MIRISFSKIQFFKHKVQGNVLVQVETENKQKYRTKQKKIKNNIAKFYGDFIEYELKNSKIAIKIFEVKQQKIVLRQKLSLKSENFKKYMKISHVIQNQNVRIYFDSQKVDNTNSSMEQQLNDFSEIKGKYYISSRMSQMKNSRQLSSEKGINKNLSAGDLRRALSRSLSEVRSLNKNSAYEFQ